MLIMKTLLFRLFAVAMIVSCGFFAACGKEDAPVPVEILQDVTILSTTPANNAGDVSVDAELRIVFDYAPMRIDTLMFAVKDAAGKAVEDIHIAASADNPKVYVITHAKFDYNTAYTVTIPTSAVAGLLSDYTFQFKTGEKRVALLTADLNPAAEPTLLDATPESGYWEHKSSFKLWEHTKGIGVTIVIVGECFDREDNKDNGVYETKCRAMATAFLKNDIIRNFRDYFDIYVAVAESEVSGIQGYPGFFGTTNNSDPNYPNNDWNIIDANVFTVEAIPALGPLLNRAWIMIFNGQAGGWASFGQPAGNCGMAWWSTAEGPVSTYWMMHEFCGHGFASLADEYPGGDAAFEFGWQSSYMVMNVSNTSDLTKVPWKKFIGLEGYEEVGAYKVDEGVWMPEEHSIMVDDANDDFYYDAMSRWMLYRRIYTASKFTDNSAITFADGEEDNLWADFLEFDTEAGYNKK
jgi:hypothetical protein